MDLGEERCRFARIALRIADFPDRQDAERLEQWLDGCINFVYRDVPEAMVRFRANGSAVVTLPAGLSSEELERMRVEECGHYLLGNDLGSFMRSEELVNDREYTIAELNERRDEAALRRFLNAWFMPADVLRRTPPEDVWECRQDWSSIRERIQTLRSLRPVALSAPPQWSAAQNYQLRLRKRPPMTLMVVPKGGSAPEYSFLVTRTFEDTAFQIWADLCALTEREFRLKYDLDAVDLGCEVEIPFEELLDWAG